MLNVIAVPVLLLSACAAASDLPVEIDPPAPSRIITTRFQSALDRKINAKWLSLPLRSILNAISREREIAILLDRRIDPGRELPWEFSGRALRVELAALAEAHGAAVSIVGNSVYIGPPQTARKLRTLVQLREAELLNRDTVLSKARDLELVRRAAIHWGDLARPADLVGQTAAKYKLEVRGIEQVPHDLWARGTLPAASAAEALSLLLIQFDLTFEWTKDASGFTIVPVPEKVALVHTYKRNGNYSESLSAKWCKEFPGLGITVRDSQIEVTGTVEAHEAIAAVLRPRAAKREPNATDETEPAPLSRQTFTLKVQRASLRSLFQELEKRGVVFEYDEKSLAAAGIDLDAKINLDVEKADAKAFFRAICEPVGLKFQIEGHTVTLSPK